MSAASILTPDNSSAFYRNLPVIPSFAEAANGNLHVEVPHDWWIVVADVRGSTDAIRAGAYKNVNTIGVACIAAVVNASCGIDVPYIFGGDGATFAVPDVLYKEVAMALRAAQRLAHDSFGMTLRVGFVRVATLAEHQWPVRMGKVRLSPHVLQPVLSGRGWDEAERRVKASDSGESKDVVLVDRNNGPAEASFDGFECRWQGVPNFNGHKLALLVAAVSGDMRANLATYQRVLNEIQSIYGAVDQYHPLRASHLHLSFNPRLLRHEWRVRSGHLPLGARLQYFARMLFMNAAGSILFALKRDTEATRWTRYKGEMVENSDIRKFDGMLRMVMDGSETQAVRLDRFLEGEYRAGNLVYGMHKSHEALVTCIVESYNGKHQHFVDGGDGGYALASRDLKRRLAKMQDRGEAGASGCRKL